MLVRKAGHQISGRILQNSGKHTDRREYAACDRAEGVSEQRLKNSKDRTRFDKGVICDLPTRSSRPGRVPLL